MVSRIGEACLVGLGGVESHIVYTVFKFGGSCGHVHAVIVEAESLAWIQLLRGVESRLGVGKAESNCCHCIRIRNLAEMNILRIDIDNALLIDLHIEVYGRFFKFMPLPFRLVNSGLIICLKRAFRHINCGLFRRQTTSLDAAAHTAKHTRCRTQHRYLAKISASLERAVFNTCYRSRYCYFLDIIASIKSVVSYCFYIHRHYHSLQHRANCCTERSKARQLSCRLAILHNCKIRQVKSLYSSDFSLNS